MNHLIDQTETSKNVKLNESRRFEICNQYGITRLQESGSIDFKVLDSLSGKVKNEPTALHLLLQMSVPIDCLTEPLGPFLLI